MSIDTTKLERLLSARDYMWSARDYIWQASQALDFPEADDAREELIHLIDDADEAIQHLLNQKHKFDIDPNL